MVEEDCLDRDYGRRDLHRGFLRQHRQFVFQLRHHHLSEAEAEWESDRVSGWYQRCFLQFLKDHIWAFVTTFVSVFLSMFEGLCNRRECFLQRILVRIL